MEYFQPVVIQRSSDSTVQQILALIQSGKLTAGDRLPGQREMSILLNVGRSSVREAYRTLEAFGVLETLSGKGTFVRSASLSHLSSSLALWLADHGTQVLQILEVRQAIESKAAELAATRGTPEALDALRRCLDEMMNAVSSGRDQDLPRLDARFHRLISQAADNDLLLSLQDSIADVALPSRNAILELPGRPRRSLEDHQRIVQAIIEHKPAEAAKAMSRHLSGAMEQIAATMPDAQHQERHLADSEIAASS